MGEAADDMLEGITCEGCGEFFDDVLEGKAPPGHPRRCAACAPSPRRAPKRRGRNAKPKARAAA